MELQYKLIAGEGFIFVTRDIATLCGKWAYKFKIISSPFESVKK